MYLRELVEHYESRGVLSKHFRSSLNDEEENEDASTMVINASNANSGAVVVEIERTGGGGDETAESTLQSRKIEYFDDFEDPVSGNLAALGNELEVYVTRPGVRRRKGVPQSVRQQMKNVRSALSSNTTKKI